MCELHVWEYKFMSQNTQIPVVVSHNRCVAIDLHKFLMQQKIKISIIKS